MAEFDSEEVDRILDHPIRRQVLLSLLERDSLNDVIASLSVELENYEDNTIEIECHHIHLPLLKNFGIIRRDGTSWAVYRGPKFEQIRPFVESTENRSGNVVQDDFAK